MKFSPHPHQLEAAILGPVGSVYDAVEGLGGDDLDAHAPACADRLHVGVEVVAAQALVATVAIQLLAAHLKKVDTQTMF